MDNRIITLFQLLKAGVTGVKPALNISQLDFEFIYKVSSINRVTNIIYYALMLYSEEERKVVTNFEKFQYVTSKYSIHHYKQELYFNEIVDVLKKNNINLTIFKGQDVQNLYPKKEMRVKGDIDFVVEKKDIKKAYELLKQIGFVPVSHSKEEIAMKKDGIVIELHKYLFAHEYKELDYLNNQHKLIDNLYVLNDEYNFVFNIDHFCKHILYGGASLKYLIDIYLLLINKKLNPFIIEDLLFKNKLSKFTKYIINICYNLFDFYNKDYNNLINDFERSEETIKKLIIYIIYGGEYGANHNTFGIRAIKKKKIKMLLEKIFPPISIIYLDYKPKLYRYLLFPFYYIKYILRMVNKTNFKKLEHYSMKSNLDLKKMFEELEI